MKDKPEKKSRGAKKPYTRPELKQVPLKPEEAVLGFCKVAGVRGPGTFTGCGGLLQCYRKGS